MQNPPEKVYLSFLVTLMGNPDPESFLFGGFAIEETEIYYKNFYNTKCYSRCVNFVKYKDHKLACVINYCWLIVCFDPNSSVSPWLTNSHKTL